MTKEKQTLNYYEIMSEAYASDIDAIEKTKQITTGLNENYFMSTGMLVSDLVMTGGVSSGMYSVSGPEQSAKSTESMEILGSAIKDDVPFIFEFDAEGSIDPDYTPRILGIENLNEILGVRNPKTNKWIIKPRIRYYTTSVLETVFETIQHHLNILPDKIYLNEKDQWYLVFRRKKTQISKMKELQKLGLNNHDKNLYTQTGMYWCPVPDNDPNFQAMYIIDSLPSLLPENIDEEKDKGNAMSVEAREFAKYLKRVVGKLRKKHAVLFCVNQLREKPMAYGNPWYEPCGNAIKFYSSVRNQMWHRAVSGVPGSWSQKEKSIFNSKAEDCYDYKLMRNIKNKKGTPYLEGWFRVWTRDHEGKGRGFDKVFDTYQYLSMTGQILPGKKKNLFKLPFKRTNFEMDFMTFKLLILAEITKDKNLIKKAKLLLNTKKLPNIREWCFRQIKDKEAFKLLFNKMNKGSDDIEDDINEEDLEDE